MDKEFDGSLIQEGLEFLKGAALREALLTAIREADEAKDHFYRMFFSFRVNAVVHNGSTYFDCVSYFVARQSLLCPDLESKPGCQ